MLPIERHPSDIPRYINQLQYTKSHNLVVEAWSRDCGYEEYTAWCKRLGQKPLDEALFEVFYEALQEQYIYDMSRGCK